MKGKIMRADLSQANTTIQPWGEEDFQGHHHQQYIRGRNAGGMRTVTTIPIMDKGKQVGEILESEDLTYTILRDQPFYHKYREIKIGDKSKIISEQEVRDYYKYDHLIHSIEKKTPEFEFKKSKYNGKFAIDYYKDVLKDVEYVRLKRPQLSNFNELLSSVAIGEKVQLAGLSRHKTKEILSKVFDILLRSR